MKIMCEVAVRHVHLSKGHVDELFGEGYELKSCKKISQPGQFLAEERVEIVGPKRSLCNVAIIGPTRTQTQVEVSRTDCFWLGLKGVEVKTSGRGVNSPEITIKVGDKSVVLNQGVIVMQRHVHLSCETADANGIKEGDMLSLVFEGERGGRFDNAVARIGEAHADAVHIDSDEGNAMGFSCSEIEVLKMEKPEKVCKGEIPGVKEPKKSKKESA